MIQDPGDRRAAEARALLIALAVARAAGWPLARRGPVLDASLSNHLYVEVAQLLLVPTVVGLERQIAITDRGMRQTRSDALIVATDPHVGEGAVTFAAGIWGRRGNAWHKPHLPWLCDRGALWLVPADLDEGSAEQPPAFPAVDGRLKPTAIPWRSPAARAHGLRRGEEWLARAVDPWR